jgi:putative DNA primase/helicase
MSDQNRSVSTLRDKLEELTGTYAGTRYIDGFIDIYADTIEDGKKAVWDELCSVNGSLKECKRDDVRKEMLELLAELHTEPATDAFYRDEKGRRQINWEILILDIMDKFVFRTIEDTEELLVFNNGVYRDGRTVVKQYIEEVLSDVADLHAIREVTAHIQRRTYTPRDVVNADKGFIPVQNGLINLDTFTLEPFDSNKIYTFKVPVTYDAKAGFEHIEQFFSEVLEPEDVRTMQEIFGYALYPKQPAHKIFWWIGTGRNGKTTTSELLRTMIGPENDAGVPLAQLDGRHRFSVSRLFGKLLNVVPEPETKTPLQTPILKSASGGDLLHGELKGVQNVFPFWNFAKFIIFANDIPEIADSSFGFWQRTLVIDFPHSFIGKDAIKNYHNVLIKKDGLAGLLNWALNGLKRLRSNDWEFTETNTQGEAKMNMQRKAQPVKTFVDDWTEFDNHIEMPKTVVYEAFKLYCDIHNIPALEERQFTPQLKQHANIRERQNTTLEGTRVRAWQGLRFKKGIVVLKTYINNIEVSADEAIDAGVDNIKFEEVALFPYLSCTACTGCTTFSYSTYVGKNIVIMEKRAILSLYGNGLETPVHPVHHVQKNEDSSESKGNPKASEEAVDRLGVVFDE